MANPPISLSLCLILSISCMVPPATAWDPLQKLFHYDNESLTKASHDYGNLVSNVPNSVFGPVITSDIVSLVKRKYDNYGSETNKSLAIRACGHSTRGQSQVKRDIPGIVINMTALNGPGLDRIRIGWDQLYGDYAQVGCEQQWLDVLKATLKRNLTPVSWTDYLHESVCGTLSNAGISGQAFKYGPQISNVYSFYAVTGKGEHKFCSPYENKDLYHACLGGLGQFAIMTSATIPLKRAPTMAKATRLLYNNFTEFSNDQEYLISTNVVNYTEGFIIVNDLIPSGWITPNSSVKISDIDALLQKYNVLYAIELSMYYDNHTINTVNQEYQMLLGKLKYMPKFIFEEDVSYFDFLYRVGDLDIPSRGSTKAHPWLVLFTPASQKEDFNKYVLAGMLPSLRDNSSLPIFYPLNAKKWSRETSAVIPDGDVFYTLGLLHSSPPEPQQYSFFNDFNTKLMDVCNENGIEFKKYLAFYSTHSQWKEHYGPKWATIVQNKQKFDPNHMLSPNLGIFN